MLKKYVLMTVVVFSVLSLGCTSRTVVESNLGIKGAPDWVNEGHQALNNGKKRFFRGIGSAPVMNDLSLQKNTADNRARAELAQVFNAFVNVLSNDYSAVVSDTDTVMNEQAMSRTIKNMTEINLVGVEIIGRWKDKKTGTLYSLAELDLEKITSLTSSVDNMNPEFKQFVQQNSTNIFDAMQQN